ncbi:MULTISPECIES: FUSC family protein [Sphingobacterium]|uniref:FUSC family membrane protein n=1 Tax=Sphingobacterium kitahiroshimense TaxID=470446 RepID=A0ABV0C1N4_9SPHI|nr:FUSC family membrane protein [Sphingobacterium sp. JUb56]MBB2952410.1 putative membrane protein YccC [Sphingobacterium sp. JUb56]
MKQTQEIKSFFYSQYFADGIRITIGCIVPVIIFAAMGQFINGTYVSLGALLVGLSDTPGAPSHRRTGMYFAGILTIITFILTVSVNANIYLLTILIAALCFIFAMFAVFNARAANVGLMCMLMMLIHVDTPFTLFSALSYLFYYSIGCLWYIIISLSITQIRPYRLTQQELAESIRHVADYLRLKANFYDINVDNDKNYLKLIEKQVEVNDHQENVRNLLFQSKRSIKDTTKTGRYLTFVFNDIIDLFEQSMATHYDYNTVSEKFGHTGILNEFKHIILKLTNELDHIAYQLNANRMPKPMYNFDQEINLLHKKIDTVEKELQYSTIALRKILINVRDIIRHINDIYSYSHLKSTEVNKMEIDEAKKFIEPSIIDFKKIRENLTLESTYFRHALRMAIVMSVSYFVAKSFHITENIFWILLTIMVILKPGFGLTKSRNIQRLMGTVIGGLIGALILFVVHDETIRFVLLIFFFLSAYSLFRVNYIVAVIFMTPYVLIMLSFVSTNTMEVTKERILDTFIGGMIAFLSSYVIFPNWEATQVKFSMQKLLIASYHYIALTLKEIAGNEPTITEYKLVRKKLYVETANMGSTFQRMLTEPKNKQKYTKDVNKFVIFNHVLASFAVTLHNQVTSSRVNHTITKEHIKLIRKILSSLETAIKALANPNEENQFIPVDFQIPENQISVDETVDENSTLMTEQLQFITKIVADIAKLVQQLKEKTSAEIDPMLNNKMH